ncbi:adenylate/guanylate cyclase domain-containing protein [Mycolicibacterium sp.]|uniref:ATP-binding protein n=1 Tax=Mycolicibacterium sp. TaxID=2320850 RepID=UPI00355F3721
MVSPVSEATGRCGACGNDLRAQARFCDACGAPVSPRPPVGEHREVAVLFVDVVGSMRLAATLDAERLQAIMNELFNRAAAVVQRYQGTVDKFTGDGLMALFGAPVALEDHALRGCIAALAIQAAANDFAAEVARCDGVALQIRVGLNSGDVITGEIGWGPGGYTAIGHPVGIAQRMEAGARPGEVLCSLSTARLIEHATRLGPVEAVAVKGADAPVPARQLLAVESGQVVSRRDDGAMLGRDAEFDRLRAVFEAGGGLVGIIGAPGLGKSRLVDEFVAFAADRGAQIVVARCESHTAAVPFRVLSRMLRALFGVDGLTDDQAAERIACCFGENAPSPDDMHILFDAMGIAAPAQEVSVDGRRRRLVELMAQATRMRPARTVFVLEDAHWIDAPSEDVLAEFGSTLAASSMLVETCRPEFDGALRRRAEHTITLRPLTASSSMRLAHQLLGPDPSTAGLADRIAVAAAGNPFFVEEIVRDLAGRGVLSGSRGGYRLTGAVERIEVPATVQAVLAARIDRLDAEAKSVLNAAAVIGTRFDIATLQALRPDGVSARLAELVSAELIDQIEFVPRQRYCFRHPLVRTVAYESQLSANRAQAHRRLAAAIEARDPGADENATLIATHLEAAGALVEAYHWHMRAAEWLRSRDLLAARAQWESAQRIADLLADDHPEAVARQIAPRTMLTSTLLYVGGDDIHAEQRYRELRELAPRIGDRRSLALATAGRIWSLNVNDIRVPEAAELASEVEEMLDGVDCDAATTAIVLNAVAFARFANCDFQAALRAAEAVVDLPGEPVEPERVSADGLRGTIEICLGRAERGRRRLRDIASASELHPVRHAGVLMYLGFLTAFGMYRGDELVPVMRDVLHRAEAFGDLCGINIAEWTYGTVLLYAAGGHTAEVVEVLTRARQRIEEHKMGTFGLPVLIAGLAREAARTGRRDHALHELRTQVALHLANGTWLFVGYPAEPLVELLLEHGVDDEVAEARRVLGAWQVHRPGLAVLDLWWYRCCALLAQADGDRRAYDERARRYLELCEQLGARGRLADARRMTAETG